MEIVIVAILAPGLLMKLGFLAISQVSKPLSLKHCITKYDLGLIHVITDPCLMVQCEFNGKCSERADRTTECICPICDSDSKTEAICGDDGKTYASYCHLKSASCKTRRKVKVIKDKPCGKNEKIDSDLLSFHIRFYIPREF